MVSAQIPGPDAMRQAGCADGEVCPIVVDDKAGKGAESEISLQASCESRHPIADRQAGAHQILQAGVMA